MVRIPASIDLLAIDRHNEHLNTLAAAEAGVGAQVEHYFPDWHVMVLSFLPGETMSARALHRPGMPT